MSRRTFLKYGVAAVAAGLVSTAAYLKINDESADIVVDHITLPIANLAASLEGITIAQLSDIHLRPLTQPELVLKAVATANSLRPDITVLTGDYVWLEQEAIFELAPIISQLNARYGVYMVLGNHDLWLDTEVILEGLRESGIPLLINQHVPITVGRGTLVLAGLDDGWSGQPDLDVTLEGAPAEAPVVALLHEPDLADALAGDGRVALQLAGHTHGGQIRIPGVGALILPYLGQKYDFGLYSVGDMWLYTNRGIGVISEPIRYNSPPEITLFTLVQP